MADSLLDSLYLSFPLGILGAVLLFYTFRAGYFRFSSISRLPVRFADCFFGFFLRFFSFYLFQSSFFYFFLHLFGWEDLPIFWEFWLNFLSLITTLVFYLFYFLRFRKPLLQSLYSCSSSSYWEDTKTALLFLAIVYPLDLFVNAFTKFLLLLKFPEHWIAEQNIVEALKTTFTSHSLRDIFLFSINTVGMAPLLEEFLFRGLLQNWLKKWLEKMVAIVLTSTVFALFHYHDSQRLGNIPIILSTFLLSLFLGAAYERRGSLFASILLHAFFNFLSTILLFLYYF